MLPSKKPKKNTLAFSSFWDNLKTTSSYSEQLFKAKILLTWQQYDSPTLKQNSKAIEFKKGILTIATKDNRLLLKLNQNKILFLKWYKKNYPQYEIQNIDFKYSPNLKILFETETNNYDYELNKEEKEKTQQLLEEKKQILKNTNIDKKVDYLKKSYNYYQYLIGKYGNTYPQSTEARLEIPKPQSSHNESYPITGLSSSFLKNNDTLQLHELLND